MTFCRSDDFANRETCWLLAVDFDGGECVLRRSMGVPIVIESNVGNCRSSSTNALFPKSRACRCSGGAIKLPSPPFGSMS